MDMLARAENRVPSSGDGSFDMSQIIKASTQLQICIRDEIRSVLDKIYAGQSLENAFNSVVQRFNKGEIFVGDNKRQMTPDEKKTFGDLFPCIIKALIPFHLAGGNKDVVLEKTLGSDITYCVSKRGDDVILANFLVPSDEPFMVLETKIRDPLQAQQTQQPISLQNQSSVLPSLSYQHPQYLNPQLQNLQQPYQQPFYPPQSAYPLSGSQTPTNAYQNEHDRRFETRRAMFENNKSFCNRIYNELNRFSNVGSNLLPVEELSPEANDAFKNLFPRISSAVNKFYENGCQSPELVMGDHRWETCFYVQRNGDSVVLTNRGDTLMTLENKLRVLAQQPVQPLIPQQQLNQYQQPHQILNPNQLYAPDNRQRSNSSPQNQPMMNQQPTYSQQPISTQQYPNQAQVPPTGYPPNYNPTGY